MQPVASAASSSRSRRFWKSFSRSHSGIAVRNERKPRGANAEIGLEQPLELEQRLVVEDDLVDFVELDPAGLEAIGHRLRGNSASCFLRVKRSSWAAATIVPSTTSAAALSW